MDAMKQITLNIKDDKFQFFMELIKSLDFVQVEENNDGDTKEAILSNIKNGLEEVKHFKQGKLKNTSESLFE